MSKKKAPALPDSKQSIPVEQLGRRQRINVTVTKSDRQIKKEKHEMKKAHITNGIKKAIFYAAQSSLLLSGITLLCKSQVKIAMAAPVEFSVSIPLYQVAGAILLGMLVYFEVTARRNSKSTEEVA